MLKNIKKISAIFSFGLAGFLIGSFINYTNIGSKNAVIHIPYFDLLVIDGNYLPSTSSDVDILNKKYTPEFKFLEKNIAENSGITNTQFSNIITNLKFDSSRGLISIRIPFYEFINNHSFSIAIDEICKFFNELSALRFKKIQLLLDRKEIILKNGASFLKNGNTVNNGTYLTASELERISLEITELKSLLKIYEINGYWGANTNSQISDFIGPLSFKFSVLFMLISLLFNIERLRIKLFSLLMPLNRE